MLAGLRLGCACTVCLCYSVRGPGVGEAWTASAAQVQQVLQVLATPQPIPATAFGRPSYAGDLLLPSTLLGVSELA